MRGLIIEKLAKLTEAKFDTHAKKVGHLKKKNAMVTFLKEFDIQNSDKNGSLPTMGNKKDNGKRIQILSSGLETKGKAVRLTGLFFDTPWFDTIDILVDAVDWDFLNKNRD